MSGRRTDWTAHFLSKISPEPNSGCWLWTGSVEEKGYAVLCKPNWKGHRPAHRFSYELFVGPIPDGLHIDHKCCVRCCVNPDHLDAVTPAENNRRQWERRHRQMAARMRAASLHLNSPQTAGRPVHVCHLPETAGAECSGLFQLTGAHCHGA